MLAHQLARENNSGLPPIRTFLRIPPTQARDTLRNSNSSSSCWRTSSCAKYTSRFPPIRVLHASAQQLDEIHVRRNPNSSSSLADQLQREIQFAAFLCNSNLDTCFMLAHQLQLEIQFAFPSNFMILAHQHLPKR